MNSRIARVAPLLFVSGFCALVYQTAWLRELRLIFGASTFASAAVLAIFMAGLGVGSAVLGKKADRWASPLGGYGTLEIIISLSAAATPGLLWLTRELYLALGGSFTMGLTLATVLRLVFATLVLLVPTVAMGGTLPCIVRAAESEADTDRRGVGILYGVNTFGAVTGAMATTFLLFEIFGTRTSLWIAALLNLLAALAARSMARSPEFAAQARPRAEEPSPVPEAGVAPRSFILVASGLVGFVFFLMELVWYRMLGPVLGGSTFTFGIILAVALAGIGLGGAIYSARMRSRPTLGAFALTCLLEGAFIALPLYLGDRVAIAAALLRPLETFGFSGLILSWCLIAAVVVFPAAVISGYQFPLLIALLGRDQQRIGSDVGHTYAANTIGAIFGSLVVGFYLMPNLGAVTTWRSAALILAGLGMVAVGLEGVRNKRWRALPGSLAIALVAILMAVAEGPTAAWRHSPIGAGRLQLAGSTTENGVESWRRAEQAKIVWEREGLESSVALSGQNGFAFIVNGKSDGHSLMDAGTQVMSGVLGALLHANPKRALVVGLGTGSSGGWLGVLPGIERVDVVEIEPAIIDVAEACTPVNADVLRNKRVHVVLGDAREFLLTTENKYDVIFSEPSNPYRAGIASLFTREFYEASRQRLGDDGVFVQWVQSYEIQPNAVRSAVATIADVFADVTVWNSTVGDLLIVARKQPAVLDVKQLRERLELPVYRNALTAAWGVDDLEGVLGTFVANDGLARAIHKAAPELINTDDLNYLEFAFARSVGHKGGAWVPALHDLARRLDSGRPQVNGPVDWDLVELRKHSLRFSAVEGPSPSLPEQFRRRVAFIQSAARGSMRQAASRLVEPGAHPESPFERTLRAEVLALRGDEAAETLAAQLTGAGSKANAELIRARLHATAGRLPEATAALIRGFEETRKDPWASIALVERSLQLSIGIATKDKAQGRALHDALQQPFSVEMLNQNRLHARVTLAGIVDYDGLCLQAFEAFEPYVPWQREMLLDRARCYETHGHPRAELAVEEFSNFVAAEPSPFSAGMEFPDKKSPVAVP